MRNYGKILGFLSESHPHTTLQQKRVFLVGNPPKKLAFGQDFWMSWKAGEPVILHPVAGYTRESTPSFSQCAVDGVDNLLTI